jgi:hypothetical protein
MTIFSTSIKRVLRLINEQGSMLSVLQVEYSTSKLVRKAQQACQKV